MRRGERNRPMVAVLAVVLLVTSALAGVADASPGPGADPAPTTAAGPLGGEVGDGGPVGDDGEDGGVGAAQVTAAGTVGLVVEAPGGDASAVAAALDGAAEVRELYGTDLVAVEVPEALVEDALADLDAHPDLAFVAYDGIATAALEPNDPLWPNSVHNGFRSARFPQAWDATTGHSSVVIAILDTGVTPVSELSGRVLPGRNFVPIVPNNNALDDDPDGHGTMSAAVAAARGNNGVGMAGACWQCRILPVKVLGADGSGAMSDVADGIRWAADNGADVISLSLTGPTGPSFLRQAVQYARGRGALVVAAAGNEGSTVPQYPAAFPEAVGVAGTNGAGTAIHVGSNRGSWVQVAASFTNPAQSNDGGFYSYAGTSSATPVVAGAAALGIAQTPSITVAELERRITQHSRSLSGIQHGYIDVARIVDGVLPRAAMAVPPGSLFGVERIRVTASDAGSGLQGAPTLTANGTSLPLSSAGSGAWTATFDTRSINRGNVTLRLRARDRVGNVRTVTRQVRVLNTPPAAGFVDVPRGAFYTVPIDFLAATRVTTGVGGSNQYAPNAPVTRGEMAVFMWRMAGQPRGTGPLFEDVQTGAFYTEAIRWLRQTGLTTGVGGSNRFEPNGPVTRAEMVTFLHRFAGWQAVSRAHSFVDVDRSSFADRGVSWAAFHRITTGVGGGNQFAPHLPVTRGEMAAFIQRYARTRAAQGGGAVPLGI